jgi:hypothetical protein
MRERARKLICPGDHCECSKSSSIEHGMTLSPSTSLGFTWVQIMNSSDYHEMKKFPKENDTQFNRKKFMVTIVWNPRGFHLIKVLEKVTSSTPAIIPLRY